VTRDRFLRIALVLVAALGVAWIPGVAGDLAAFLALGLLPGLAAADLLVPAARLPLRLALSFALAPLVASTVERHIVARVKSIFEAEQLLGRRERLRLLPQELEKIFATLPLVSTALALMGGDAGPRHLAAAASIALIRA